MGEQTVIRMGAATHVGRVRQLNEDSYVAEGGVFAVADGMGGHAAGEVASQIGVLTLRDLTSRHPLRTDDVVDTLRECNRRILKAAAASPDTEGMGTTMAGVTIVRRAEPTTGASSTWGLACLSAARQPDESGHPRPPEVRELLDAGLITVEEAQRHPMRNVITCSWAPTRRRSPTSGSSRRARGALRDLQRRPEQRGE